MTNILETDFDLGDFFIKETVIFDPSEKGGQLVCRAVMFELSDGGCFFLDPSFPWGIKTGGRELYKKWLDNRLSRSLGVPERSVIGVAAPKCCNP